MLTSFSRFSLVTAITVFGFALPQVGLTQEISANDEATDRREFLHWFSRTEQLETFTFHAELHLRKSANNPLGPNRQYRYWRDLDKERVLRFFDTGVFDAESGQRKNGAPTVIDWRWNGKECLEIDVDAPFRPREVRIGVPSLIDYNLYNWKFPGTLESDWPVWMRPDVAGAVSLPPREYASVATSIRKISDPALAEPPLEIFEVHFPVMPNWEDKTNIVHRWWMDPQKGNAPVKFQTSYKAHGGNTIRNYTVTAWHEFETENYWFPKQYTQEFIDDENGTMQVFAIQDINVIDCQINSKLPESLFSIDILPGIPVHFYDEEKKIVQSFMARNDQSRAIVYEAATTPNETRPDAIKTFIRTNKDDSSFIGEFQGYRHALTDWSSLTELPAQKQENEQNDGKSHVQPMRLWPGVVALFVITICAFGYRQLAKRNLNPDGHK